MDVLWILTIVFLLSWLLGVGFHIGGGLIHLLLVITVIVLVVRLIRGDGVV